MDFEYVHVDAGYAVLPGLPGAPPGARKIKVVGHLTGGYPITKSRRYSVTFGYLRGERVQHRRAQRWPDGERDP
jgi:hypothetical protein